MLSPNLIKEELTKRLCQVDLTPEFISEITKCCLFCKNDTSTEKPRLLLADIIFSVFNMGISSTSVLSTNPFLIDDFLVWKLWLNKYFPNYKTVVSFSNFIDEISSLSIFTKMEDISEREYLRSILSGDFQFQKSKIRQMAEYDIYIQLRNVLLCDEDNFQALCSVIFQNSELQISIENKQSLLIYELLMANLDKVIQIDSSLPSTIFLSDDIDFEICDLSFSSLFLLYLQSYKNEWSVSIEQS